MSSKAITFAAFLACHSLVRAQGGEMPAVPPSGCDADHFRSLWTASPFVLATPESTAVSAEFSLVGVACFEGVSYASLVDTGTQEHFTLSSDKPVHGLTLLSVAKGKTGATVNIQRASGELMILKEAGSSRPAGGSAISTSDPTGSEPAPAEPLSRKPPVRVHHRVVLVPPPVN